MSKLQVIVCGIGLSVSLSYLIFFTTPSSWYIVVLFIILLSFLGYAVSGIFVKRKYQYLITLLIALLLSSNYIAGFQVLNTILIVSFIIGLTILINSK